MRNSSHEWDLAIMKLNPDNTSYGVLKDFLANNAEGKLLNPV